MFVLTQGGPDDATLAPSTSPTITSSRRSASITAAVSTVQMVLTLGLAVMFLAFQRRQAEQESSDGRSNRFRRQSGSRGGNTNPPDALTYALADPRDPSRAAGLHTLFPFFIALLNAFKPGTDYVRGGPLSIPTYLQFDSIVKFWTQADYSRKLINSTLISVSVSILAVGISLFNAYALGIGRVKGSSVILAILLLGTMVPQESIIYPIYWMAKSVGLYDAAFGDHRHGGAAQRLRHLSLVLGDEHLPARDPRGGRDRRRDAPADLDKVVIPIMSPTLMIARC